MFAGNGETGKTENQRKGVCLRHDFLFSSLCYISDFIKLFYITLIRNKIINIQRNKRKLLKYTHHYVNVLFICIDFVLFQKSHI
jgi:hypothetical protein